ncbi:hypothetical protein HYS91_04610 [Candidatus Daviesbacteria bacterium]|nr:hypothetical protein [Candidatus Daviesbacteria bacterium]
MKKHFLLFFLDDFHQGAMNHLIHFVGFTVLGYGLGKPSLFLIILSPFIMESGHIYNYLTGRHKELAIKIIPLQLLAWVIFVGIGYLIANFFGY